MREALIYRREEESTVTNSAGTKPAARVAALGVRSQQELPRTLQERWSATQRASRCRRSRTSRPHRFSNKTTTRKPLGRKHVEQAMMTAIAMLKEARVWSRTSAAPTRSVGQR